jgi:hypothetical protein
MEYDTRTYFEEKDCDEVNGFVVVDTNTDSQQYHIAEKWVRDLTDDKWIQYWIDASRLSERVDDGKCEPKATVTDEQYEAVCGKFDDLSMPAEA